MPKRILTVLLTFSFFLSAPPAARAEGETLDLSCQSSLLTRSSARMKAGRHRNPACALPTFTTVKRST